MLKIFVLLTLFNSLGASIILNTTDFYYTFWLDDLSVNGSSVTVCAQDAKNFPLKLYVNLKDKSLEDFSVFDSNITSNFIGTLNSDIIASSSILYPRKIISSSGCFTVARSNTTSGATKATLFFIRENIYGTRCQAFNNDTVFQAGSGVQNNNLTFTFPNLCEIFILAPPSSFPQIPIESISPKDVTRYNQIIFKSAVNKNIYLDTAITTAPLVWQNLRFYTNALSVTIYGNTLLQLSNKTASFSRSQTSIQKGFIASPSYGGFNQIIDSKLLSFNIDSDVNMTIIFNIKQMDQQQQLILQNNDLKQNFTVKLNFSSNAQRNNLQFYGKSFTIFYSQQTQTETSFLIYYTIGPANLKTKIATISTANPSHVVLLENLQEGEGATVCLFGDRPEDGADIGLNVDLYASNINNYFFKLYASDDGNFDMFLQNLNSSRKSSTDGKLSKVPLPQFSKRCITIYRDYNYYNSSVQGIVVFKYFDGYTDCGVFDPKPTVNLTNPYNALCKYTILAPQYSHIQFSNMSMRTNKTVEILSELNQQSLLRIRNNEINQWQQLQFFTPVVGIIVPINGFFSFTLGYTNYIQQVVAGQKGIIASPGHNGFYSPSTNKTNNYKNYEILTRLSTFSFGNSLKFSVDVYAYNVYIENVSEKKNYTLDFEVTLNGNNFNVWYLNDPNNNFYFNYEFLGDSSSAATFKQLSSITVIVFISFLLKKVV